MYKVGDYVIHGSNGACRIEGIGPLTGDLSGSDKLYYTMTTCYTRSTIYSPVESPKVLLRPIMTKAEAESLLEDAKNIRPMVCKDEKQREQDYRDGLRTGSCVELIRIIKAIEERKEQRLKQGKKSTASDDKFCKLAEDSLYGELAIALGIPKEEVKDAVAPKLSAEL